ncbi:MAG: TraR/DksA family transcriptional regulator [Gammaproteobacteria bacterium]|nr:TraR/DksA family transcriptional regulator [Gammaproteobacteria bacterium]
MAKGNGKSDLDLDAIREALHATRSELLDRVRRLDKDVHHREEPLPADFAEQATALENQEVLEALDEDARVELRQIDRALKRLDEGVYGECASCGDTIAPERLRAIVWATLCIDCASLAEQRSP